MSKTRAQKRRKSRRVDAAESRADTSAPNVPSAQIEGITIVGNGEVIGLKVSPGYRAKAKGITIRGTEVGVDNEGEFEGPDTKFE